MAATVLAEWRDGAMAHDACFVEAWVMDVSDHARAALFEEYWIDALAECIRTTGALAGWAGREHQTEWAFLEPTTWARVRSDFDTYVDQVEERIRKMAAVGLPFP